MSRLDTLAGGGAPTPIRSAVAPSTHVIVYDGDCRLCTRAARWAVARARTPMTAIPSRDIPREAWLTSLSEAESLRQAHLITPDGIEYHGGAAATAALRQTRYAALGRLLDAPVLRLARDAGYALAVRWRGTLSLLLGSGAVQRPCSPAAPRAHAGLSQAPQIASTEIEAEAAPAAERTTPMMENATVTESGLKYVDHEVGTGESPRMDQQVTVHYTGKLASNDRKFDSSVDRGEPATFPMDGVIKGFSEGLSTMKVGGKRTVFIPSGLGYGPRGTGPIPPNADLIFELELIAVR